MRELWLLLHIVAVAVWIGGMFFAHHCLRLALMSAALARFFAALHVAIAVLWLSGLAMLAGAGLGQAPLAWHLMLGLGSVMTVIFAVVAWRLHPRLRAAVAGGRWADGAAALARIRGLVAANLAIGLATIAVATAGRLL